MSGLLGQNRDTSKSILQKKKQNSNKSQTALQSYSLLLSCLSSYCPILTDVFSIYAVFILFVFLSQGTNNYYIVWQLITKSSAAVKAQWWKTLKIGTYLFQRPQICLLYGAACRFYGQAGINSASSWAFTACFVVMCQQGDLKRYLRAQRKSDGMTPDLPNRDLLTLQRMAFEITSGLLHLHENNYIHRSDMSQSVMRTCVLKAWTHQANIHFFQPPSAQIVLVCTTANVLLTVSSCSRLSGNTLHTLRGQCTVVVIQKQEIGRQNLFDILINSLTC